MCLCLAEPETEKASNSVRTKYTGTATTLLLDSSFEFWKSVQDESHDFYRKFPTKSRVSDVRTSEKG